MNEPPSRCTCGALAAGILDQCTCGWPVARELTGVLTASEDAGQPTAPDSREQVLERALEAARGALHRLLVCAGAAQAEDQRVAATLADVLGIPDGALPSLASNADRLADEVRVLRAEVARLREVTDA